jgi:hypothetical protein
MKYIIFNRESNDFTDIESDKNLPKKIPVKIRWKDHLMLGFSNYKNENDSIFSYIKLKYGEDILDKVCIDRTPIPYVDYVPDRKENC